MIVSKDYQIDLVFTGFLCGSDFFCFVFRVLFFLATVEYSQYNVWILERS